MRFCMNDCYMSCIGYSNVLMSSPTIFEIFKDHLAIWQYTISIYLLTYGFLSIGQKYCVLKNGQYAFRSEGLDWLMFILFDRNALCCDFILTFSCWILVSLSYRDTRWSSEVIREHGWKVSEGSCSKTTSSWFHFRLLAVPYATFCWKV